MSDAPPGSGVVSRFVVRQRAKRDVRRASIHVRVIHPISAPQLLRDPLVHHASPLRSTVRTTRVLIAAVVVHGLVLVAFLIVNQMIGGSQVTGQSEAVQVQIRDVPPPPPPPEELDDSGPVVDDFAELEPETPPPPKEAPVDPPALVPTKSEPPPDAEVEEPTPEAPPRRVIGVSMESTVKGGSGPSFATGTSRMGRTAATATEPTIAARKPSGSAAPSKEPGSTREQRAASYIPTQEGVLVKPKRTTPTKPPFPSTLRAQGIEGDVVVRVKIAASGVVTAVDILQSSGHQAFDDAARKAAFSEQFLPATRDGKSIDFTLTYSYRFRIED